jgi:hypothetical protein
MVAVVHTGPICVSPSFRASPCKQWKFTVHYSHRGGEDRASRGDRVPQSHAKLARDPGARPIRVQPLGRHAWPRRQNRNFADACPAHGSGRMAAPLHPSGVSVLGVGPGPSPPSDPGCAVVATQVFSRRSPRPITRTEKALPRPDLTSDNGSYAAYPLAPFCPGGRALIFLPTDHPRGPLSRAAHDV